jgi:hypothetical protein
LLPEALAAGVEAVLLVLEVLLVEAVLLVLEVLDELEELEDALESELPLLEPSFLVEL